MQIYTQNWVILPQIMREKMREYFGVRRSTSTHVDGGRIICDGSSNADLQVITVEKMQSLLKTTETDFGKLWGETIQNFETSFKSEEAKAEAAALKAQEFEARQEEIKAAEIIHEVAKKVAKLNKSK